MIHTYKHMLTLANGKGKMGSQVHHEEPKLKICSPGREVFARATIVPYTLG
jgi:hypothetical protein